MKTSAVSRRWEREDDHVDPPYRHKGCAGVATFTDDHAICAGCGQVWKFVPPGPGRKAGWVPR